MKITAHVEIVGAGLPYEKAFPMLGGLGAQGVELVIKDGAPLSLASNDADFLRAKELAHNEGLVITGATSGYSWSLPMTSDSASVRAAGDKAMERVLEGAALLGTDSLLIAPGYAKTAFYTPSEVIDEETAIARALTGVRSAAQYAALAGVSLNVEVVWSGMLRTPLSMREFILSVDSPYVAFYMDTGNVYPEGDPVEWIRVMARYIRRVHMKDFSFEREGMDAFCALGDGCVDFRAVMNALRDIGYNGWIGAEHHARRSEAGGAHSLNFLRSLTELKPE